MVQQKKSSENDQVQKLKMTQRSTNEKHWKTFAQDQFKIKIKKKMERK